MKESLSEFDLPTLRRLHEQEMDRLHTQLMNGAQWHEVQEQKRKVTDLTLAIHQKLEAAAGQKG